MPSTAEIQEIVREAAKNDYAMYCLYTHRGRYKHGRHTRAICRRLELLERGIIDKLMLLLPPRHSKSMTASETFPSYFLGKDPVRTVIETSYGDRLAQKFGWLNRKKIDEFGRELFGIGTEQGNKSKTNWKLDNGIGGMISAGIGGPITGEGAHLLLIDDPVKNRQQAESETYREKVWDEWQNTLLTRTQPDAKIIIIQTRWHEDDLAGRLLKTEGDEWTVLRIPAICDDPTAPIERELGRDSKTGRVMGEALWPEYGYDELWAAKKKGAVGTYAWESLYQGNPRPKGGGVFKENWWRYWTRLPHDAEVWIQSWDLAFDDTEGSSFVVGQVWTKAGANVYLVDQVRGRWDFVETLRQFEELTRRWPEARAKYVEAKANGPALKSQLDARIPGIILNNPGTESKLSRALAVQPFFEAGNVYLPTAAHFLPVYKDELHNFTGKGLTDQTDTTTQAVRILLGDAMAGGDVTRSVPGL